MKASHAALATAAFAATGVFAQTYGEDEPWTSMSSSDSVSYTTVTYDDCPSSMMASMITVTQGETITYCPECDHMSSAMKPPYTGPGYTTVYTTTYLSLCSTGTVPVTYTVTESCTDATPTWTPGPSHIPPGFTVTTKSCDACGASSMPMTVTITEPCGCEAHEGSTVKPPATTPHPAPAVKTSAAPRSGAPVTEKSDGQPEVPVATHSAPTGPAPAPWSSEPACEGECGGEAHGKTSPGTSAPPAPAGSYPAAVTPPPSATTTTESCPGPACQAATSSMVRSGTPADEQPVNGASSHGSSGLLLSFAVATIVAALAFTL